MYSVITRTLACGISSASAKPSRVPCTACVDDPRRQLVALPLADAAVRLERHVRLHLRRVAGLDDVRGRLEAGLEIAVSPRASPALMLPSLKTGGAPCCIACATVAMCGSTSYSTLISRSASSACSSVAAATRGDLVALEHHLLAGLEHGQHGLHAGRLLRRGRDRSTTIARVRVRRAQDAAVQHAGTVDVVRVLRAAGDLHRPVEPRARACRAASGFVGPRILLVLLRAAPAS